MKEQKQKTIILLGLYWGISSLMGILVVYFLFFQQNRNDSSQFSKGNQGSCSLKEIPADQLPLMDESIHFFIPNPVSEEETPDNLKIENFIFDYDGTEEPVAINIAEIRSFIRYPKGLKKGKVEGKVVFQVQVSKKGHYKNHKLVNSSHPLFTISVEEHIHKIRFLPACCIDDTSSYWVNVPFMFQIPESSPSDTIKQASAKSMIKRLDKMIAETEDEPIPTPEENIYHTFKLPFNELTDPINLNEIKKLNGYPDLAREPILGIVVLKIAFDEHGQYRNHLVLKSPHDILTKTVEKNIHLLRWEPFSINGKLSPFVICVPFQFVLLD